MNEKGCLTMGILAVCLIFVFLLEKCHQEELSSDGFKVIETHESYYLVEKEGHQYIATESGMYSLHWSYEHYPKCPCNNKNN